MSASIDRRDFLKLGASATLAVTAVHSNCVGVAVAADDKPLRIGVMGLNGRGGALCKAFISLKAEIAYVCDVDQNVLNRAVGTVANDQGKAPQGIGDLRTMLDDKTVDAIAVAAPNHWHAPATILGCSHGKHVYVEKPCSHNPREGELAVAAARKYDRVVTMGSQRRSWPAIIEAIEKLHAGEIGKLHYARAWYNNRRPYIGIGKQVAPPSTLNWELWQGPAAEKPFKDNLVHYNWHWHWHYGNGELGNNGVHALDVARWGMQADYPIRVTSGGGKYRHDDDQETPDTHVVTYDFPGNKSIMWEGLSWSPYGPGGSQFGTSFHGEEGSMLIVDSGYKIFDPRNKEIAASTGAGGDADHVRNFLECIRSGKRPNADIEEAHKSTLLCHLGNISYRVNRVLSTSAEKGQITDDDEAAKLWTRDYRAGWEPQV
jgi:predicted dehydrogenase